MRQRAGRSFPKPVAFVLLRQGMDQGTDCGSRRRDREGTDCLIALRRRGAVSGGMQGTAGPSGGTGTRRTLRQVRESERNGTSARSPARHGRCSKVMTIKRSSRSSASGFADTAGANPFAVFEIIADARRIQHVSSAPDIFDSAIRIEKHADGMVKIILGTSDLSITEIPTSVIEQIVELLRNHRQ